MDLNVNVNKQDMGVNGLVSKRDQDTGNTKKRGTRGKGALLLNHDGES